MYAYVCERETERRRRVVHVRERVLCREGEVLVVRRWEGRYVHVT